MVMSVRSRGAAGSCSLFVVFAGGVETGLAAKVRAASPGAKVLDPTGAEEATMAEISQSRWAGKELLLQSGVPTPYARHFASGEYQAAAECVRGVYGARTNNTDSSKGGSDSFDLKQGGQVVGAGGQCLTVATQPAVTGSPGVTMSARYRPWPAAICAAEDPPMMRAPVRSATTAESMAWS